MKFQNIYRIIKLKYSNEGANLKVIFIQNYNRDINMYKNIAKKYNKVYNINRINNKKKVRI